jgi:tripartite-type tricarboxylate transporter receptor subunit TctC
MPADAAAYWEGRFAALRETPSWKKYIHDNQLEESFLPGAQLRTSITDIERQLREQFVQAGVKVVR